MYEESTKLLEEGALLSCDPMLEIILGKNAQATLDSLSAQRCYPAVNHNELTDSDIQNDPRKRLPGSL